MDERTLSTINIENKTIRPLTELDIRQDILADIVVEQKCTLDRIAFTNFWQFGLVNIANILTSIAYAYIKEDANMQQITNYDVKFFLSTALLFSVLMLSQMHTVRKYTGHATERLVKNMKEQ